MYVTAVQKQKVEDKNEWIIIKNIVNDVSVKVIGRKRIRNNNWFDSECEMLTEKKVKNYT